MQKIGWHADLMRVENVNPGRIHHKVNFFLWLHAAVNSVIQVWPVSEEHPRWTSWERGEPFGSFELMFLKSDWYLIGIVKLWMPKIGWHVEFVIVENVNPGRIHHKVNLYLWLRLGYAVVTLSEHLVNIMRNRCTFCIIPVDLLKTSKDIWFGFESSWYQRLFGILIWW